AIHMLEHVGDGDTAHRVQAAVVAALGNREVLTPELGGAGTTRTLSDAIGAALEAAGAGSRRGWASAAAQSMFSCDFQVFGPARMGVVAANDRNRRWRAETRSTFSRSRMVSETRFTSVPGSRPIGRAAISRC